MSEFAVAIVVVSYNVAPLLGPCLESAQRGLEEVAADGVSGHLVVVDNASADGSAALVRERFPQATLIANDENRGFGAACNQALGAGGPQQAILFLNPDARLHPGALPALVGRLRRQPAAAIVGPRVQFPDGRPQPTRRRFPTLGTLIVESTPLQWRSGGSWLSGSRLLDRFHYAGQPETAGVVDWLSGSCLLARAAALRQVGGFDPGFFMYFEEVDLCRRLAAGGWETWYEPAARVTHHHSQSADQNLVTKDRRYFTSKYRYAARYLGGAAGRMLRVSGALIFGAELAIQLARGDRVLASRYAALVRWHLTGRSETEL